MNKKPRPFPLVADSEPVFTTGREMQLYDTNDLITNIKGYYQDKPYLDDLASAPQSRPSRPAQAVSQPVFEPAERARQEAKADLKKKRQALITSDKSYLSKPFDPLSKPQRPVAKPQKTWGKYAQNLRQDTYILAELPQVYEVPQNTSAKEVKKNSYDFLKRSQIYNPELSKATKDRRQSQELTLSRFEDKN